MILDSLKNLDCYKELNPNFAKAIEFLKNSDLANLPLGRNEICGDLVYANVMEVKPKLSSLHPYIRGSPYRHTLSKKRQPQLTVL